MTTKLRSALRILFILPVWLLPFTSEANVTIGFDTRYAFSGAVPGELMAKRVMENAGKQVEFVDYDEAPSREAINFRISVLHFDRAPEGTMIASHLMRARYRDALSNSGDWHSVVAAISSDAPNRAFPLDGFQRNVVSLALLIEVFDYSKKIPTSFSLPIYAESEERASGYDDPTTSRAWHVVEAQLRRIVDFGILRSGPRKNDTPALWELRSKDLSQSTAHRLPTD